MYLELSKEEFFTRGGLLDKLLDQTFDQAVVVDKDARILFFSKSSEQFSGKPAESVLGESIEKDVPQHGFFKVLKTGVADNGILTNIRGNLALTNHIPVKDHDEIIGAIGIVFLSNLTVIKKLIGQLTQTNLQEYSEIYNNISRLSNSYSFNDFIGQSEPVLKLIENARKAARSHYPVLLLGETGTGKEIIANAIHGENPQTFLNPFVKLNCSSIPASLLESELFGHKKVSSTHQLP